MLKEELFLEHSFNEECFLELRKKKEATFKLNSNNVAEQLTSAKKKILEKEEPVTRPEFHRRLNSIRDLGTLTTYCNRVRDIRRAHGVTHDYIITQYAIRACKIKEGLWY
ncbi:hypothetical protein RhiirA5_424254 [Rhizophagus irregularis]|uniref:Uncharacterized protein n=1 Tax=Rhizophagus irregularis TaxID=588596 RepID=A0A2I1FMH3_9GLOM|nr:hypothetical protein RhiirA5_424254 [Rhizophagus irregularis]PKC70623.1 hypothetical protein RhiirA1_454505 [Rhizophagus irregularis]PKY35581.1 hypothetical protein RhiirB3_456576 [Rhizophagus irregularis]CAB4468601.1 unnamed protein product [Rhizophagus irregularis]CAB5177059.1 unnamed protein product [Rhizophagus irregularis]